MWREWLAYFPFDSLIRGFEPRWAYFCFSKNKLTERSLKCACHSVDWMVSERWLKCDWNPPFPSPFSRHSATIQSPFSRLKGKISSCAKSKVINEHPNPWLYFLITAVRKVISCPRQIMPTDHLSYICRIMITICKNIYCCRTRSFILQLATLNYWRCYKNDQFVLFIKQGIHKTQNVEVDSLYYFPYPFILL